jgi:hypothetical protein
VIVRFLIDIGEIVEHHFKYISNVSYFYIIKTRFSIKGLETESDVVIYWYNNGISTVSIIGVISRVVRGGRYQRGYLK